MRYHLWLMRLSSASFVLAPLVFVACGSGASATNPTGSAAEGSGGASSGSGGASAGGANAGGTNTGGVSNAGGANASGMSGSGGATGAGGMAGAGGGGGGGPGGMGSPCTHGGAPCDPGFYCDAVGCGTGSCQPVREVAQQTKNYAPSCGCNGVTYFNGSLAEVAGMAVSHSGVCTPQEGIACTKQNLCPSGLACNAEVANQAACVPVLQAAGFCWDVPVGCDPNGTVRGRGCLNGICADRCSLIQGQNPWHPDATCP